MVAYLETQKMDVFTAAARGLTERMRQMVEADPACVEARFETVLPEQSKPSDRDWLTPLAVAVANGRVDMMRMLLGLGADPTAGYGADATLIGLAEDRSDQEIGRLLRNAVEGRG